MKTQAINQSFQKEHNISVVLRALLAHDGCTRMQLCQATGLTQPTMTKIISQLLEWNAVYEQESIGSGVGRKAVCLHLNAEMYRVLSVRINRKYISAAIYDPQGGTHGTARCEISVQEGARSSMLKTIRLLRALLAEEDHPVLGIGVAVPGPFNYQTGRISLMSGFPGWNEVDIRAELEQVFHLPTLVDHDANCGALAELWHSSSAHQSENMLFVCADRGIGAGLILNGSVYRGSDGFAGEFGHASVNMFGPVCECGNRGCLELYASASALENAYLQQTSRPLSTDDILTRVRLSQPDACAAYQQIVHNLCCGVVGLINTLNPDAVVFADRLINGGPCFLDTARRTLKERLIPEIYQKLRIRLCTLDEDPMLLGASVLVFDRLLHTPSAFFRMEKAVRQPTAEE